MTNEKARRLQRRPSIQMSRRQRVRPRPGNVTEGGLEAGRLEGGPKAAGRQPEQDASADRRFEGEQGEQAGWAFRGHYPADKRMAARPHATWDGTLARPRTRQQRGTTRATRRRPRRATGTRGSTAQPRLPMQESRSGAAPAVAVPTRSLSVWTSAGGRGHGEQLVLQDG